MREEILKKFLSNKCSYKECDFVVRYLEDHEDELDKIQLFEHIPENELTFTSSEVKQHILHSILPRKAPIVTLKRLLIAAAILIAATFPFYKIGMHDIVTEDNLRISLTNTSGSSLWHLLPDSSRVKLEPQSKLVYYSNFNSDRAIEQVSGEATFYVYPDKEHPFHVNNRGIKTTALGTIFSISDYNKDELLIKLLEGKIVVSKDINQDDQQVFLNDQATLIINTNNFHHQLVLPAKPNFKKAWEEEKKNSRSNYSVSTIAWSNRVVNFKGVTNADLFSIMERLYSVTIDVENTKIINGNFTGNLKQNDNIENLLTIFCQINECQFSRDNDIITIK